jgi:DNA-binding NarL/FixJ family response regulator
MISPLLPGSLAEHGTPPIHVLLVDDNPEFLESAARFLATDPAIEIVGRALAGPAALEQVGAQQPDLVLVDLMMPGMNGLELTSLLKSRPNPPRVIIVTLYGVAEYAAASAAAQADGLVAKSEFGTRLLPMIHALFARPAA